MKDHAAKVGWRFRKRFSSNWREISVEIRHEIMAADFFNLYLYASAFNKMILYIGGGANG